MFNKNDDAQNVMNILSESIAFKEYNDRIDNMKKLFNRNMYNLIASIDHMIEKSYNCHVEYVTKPLYLSTGYNPKYIPEDFVNGPFTRPTYITKEQLNVILEHYSNMGFKIKIKYVKSWKNFVSFLSMEPIQLKFIIDFNFSN